MSLTPWAWRLALLWVWLAVLIVALAAAVSLLGAEQTPAGDMVGLSLLVPLVGREIWLTVSILVK